MDGWMDGRVGGWMDGWMDGLSLDGWMGGWTNGWMEINYLQTIWFAPFTSYFMIRSKSACSTFEWAEKWLNASAGVLI